MGRTPPRRDLARLSEALAQRLSHSPELAYVNNGNEERLTADGEFLFRHPDLVSAEIMTTPHSAAIIAVKRLSNQSDSQA